MYACIIILLLYSMCVYIVAYPELPLVLYDSVYEGVEWRRCERNYLNVVSHFQKMWTELTVRSVVCVCVCVCVCVHVDVACITLCVQSRGGGGVHVRCL